MTVITEETTRSRQPEEYCSRTVVFPAIVLWDRWRRWGGSTWIALLLSSSFPSRLGPLSTTSSVSGCRWELWSVSLHSTSRSPPRLLSLPDPSFRLRLRSASRYLSFLSGFDMESRGPMSVLRRCRIQTGEAADGCIRDRGATVSED